MMDDHQPIPATLEQVVSRLSELEIILAEPARSAIPTVRTRLIDAMAARDRGDQRAAFLQIGRAMDDLAAVADRLDPAEAVLMRALAHRFRTALACGDPATARDAASVMFQKSGAREIKKT